MSDKASDAALPDGYAAASSKRDAVVSEPSSVDSLSSADLENAACEDSGDTERVRPLSGIDLARATLARARAEARQRGTAAPARRRSRSRAGGRPRREPGDPEPLGETLGRLLAERGWDVPTAVVGVTQRWGEIAGADLAAHCRPDKFEDGVLSLIAESTAWATQVRLLVPQLRKRLDDVVGKGIVTRVRVRGPSGPDWRRGPLRVRGPGPRDTYG